LENSFSNPHSFVKKCTTKFVVFFPMQFSYEALQRCMLLAHFLHWIHPQ